MGLFSAFKHLKNAAAAGGNFGFIAQNVATIYYVLGELPFGKTIDDDKRLYATGILDAIVYIANGSIAEEDISDCVLCGKVGRVSLGLYYQEHRDLFDYEENRDLIGLTMQLEALIFSVSNTDVDYREIVNQVVAQKKTISDMVNRTLKEGKKSPLYQNVLFNVSNWLSDPQIVELINGYQLN